jgi:transcriptional regulator with XRE-family HTH domain
MARTRSTTPVDALVGHNIRICRLQQGLSQTELAQRIGVTFQQVQKYENGANRVSASRMTQVADALRVPLLALFEGSASAGGSEPLDLARALLAKPHSLRVVQAFNKPPNDGMRMSILQLIEAITRRGSRPRASQQTGAHR